MGKEGWIPSKISFGKFEPPASWFFAKKEIGLVPNQESIQEKSIK